LLRVTVAMHNDQKLDGAGVGGAEMARQASGGKIGQRQITRRLA
jgi:hypothetical protein